MLISSATADAIAAGQRTDLRQIDRHGRDLSPVAPGTLYKIVCFTQRGMVTFGLTITEDPMREKYMAKDNAFVLWSNEASS